jgi:hypothetical protein
MKRSTFRAFAAIASLMAGLGCAESPAAPGAPTTGSVRLLRAPTTSSVHASRSGAGSASAVIGPDGGGIVLGNARIEFPAGALGEPTTITMSAASGLYGVELQPHGLVFPQDAQPTLTVGYAAAAAAGFSRLSLVYVDDRMNVLEVLPTQSDTQTGSLTARLPHFSGYMAGGS